MPFKSKAQMRACWAEYNRKKKAGLKPTWDCHEFYYKTKQSYASLPDYKTYIGPRGGHFIKKYGVKKYIKNGT